MPALIGRYEHALDAKNRVFVPARYRELLAAEQGRHFILSIGLDRCLYLFLPSQWEQLLTSRQEEFRLKDKRKQRAVRRVLFSNAVEAPVDEQGRILIPQELKGYAGLRKRIVMAGSGTRAELWDDALFAKEHAPAMNLFRKMSADVDL
ncbi:MAG: division/cell wall cluster transcriptional repressor MraZ [Elusimicrobia bacterium]|nr:division/cell wall cluster transcriptional repressor MraZ [Elusimicrobiota bacterium]